MIVRMWDFLKSMELIQVKYMMILVFGILTFSLVIIYLILCLTSFLFTSVLRVGMLTIINCIP